MNWKKLYFVLDNHTLSWWKSEKVPESAICPYTGPLLTYSAFIYA